MLITGNLWKLLIDYKINKTELKNISGISYNVLAKLAHNEFISMESLLKLCLALKWDIGILSLSKNKNESKGDFL